MSTKASFFTGKNTSHFHFPPQTDMIYSLNMPLLTVYGMASGMDLLSKSMINGIPARFPQEITVVQRKTVAEWLWGSNSKFLAELKGTIAKLPPGYVPAGMKGS